MNRPALVVRATARTVVALLAAATPLATVWLCSWWAGGGA